MGANELEEESNKEIINPEKKKKKAPAEGYESGSMLLFKQAKASEFIMGDKAIHLLNNCYEIVLDEARIRKHKTTTPEIVECCKDIKVLGMKELRLLKKWREALRKDFEKMDKEKTSPLENGVEKEDEGEDEEESEEEEDEDLKMLEGEIDMLKDEERRAARRQKKKKLKAKQRMAQKINMEMVIPGDEGPVRKEEGLFQISKSGNKVTNLTDQAPDVLAEDSDEEVTKKAKFEKYDKEHKRLDKSGLYYKNSDESSGEEGSEDEDSDKEDLGLDSEGEEVMESDDEEEIDRLNDPSQNPLLVDMESSDRKTRKEKKANMWFDKDIFRGIEEDEDLEEADVNAAIKAIKKKGGKVPEKKKEPVKKASKKPAKPEEESDDTSGSDSDSDYDENEFYPYRKQKGTSGGGGAIEKEGFEVVPVQKIKKRPMLSPEELASAKN